jgi:hypothetical protein
LGRRPKGVVAEELGLVGVLIRSSLHPALGGPSL